MLTGITDKAARYQHCLSNEPNNVVRLTQATPGGTRTFDMAGQIPRRPVRSCSRTTTTTGRSPRTTTPTWSPGTGTTSTSRQAQLSSSPRRPPPSQWGGRTDFDCQQFAAGRGRARVSHQFGWNAAGGGRGDDGLNTAGLSSRHRAGAGLRGGDALRPSSGPLIAELPLGLRSPAQERDRVRREIMAELTVCCHW